MTDHLWNRNPSCMYHVLCLPLASFKLFFWGRIASFRSVLWGPNVDVLRAKAFSFLGHSSSYFGPSKIVNCLTLVVPKPASVIPTCVGSFLATSTNLPRTGKFQTPHAHMDGREVGKWGIPSIINIYVRVSCTPSSHPIWQWQTFQQTSVPIAKSHWHWFFE